MSYNDHHNYLWRSTLMEQVLTSSWYENGTLYNWAKHSLSNHVNDRQYQNFAAITTTTTTTTTKHLSVSQHQLN